MQETGIENLIWHMSSIYGHGLCFQQIDGLTLGCLLTMDWFA